MDDWVFLKLSLWKGVVRFEKRGKLSPRFIGPYQILERVGSVVIDWTCLLLWRRFMMYSIYPCSASILRIPLMFFLSSLSL